MYNASDGGLMWLIIAPIAIYFYYLIFKLIVAVIRYLNRK